MREVYHRNGEYIVIEQEELPDNPTQEQMSAYVWEEQNRFIFHGNSLKEGKYTNILPVGTVCQTLFKQRRSGLIVTRQWRDANGSQGQSYPYVGYMYATPDRIIEYLNVYVLDDPQAPEVIQKQKLACVHHQMESDLRIFNLWSEGLVFGFRKFATGVEDEDNHGILTLSNEIDSCWEFYGDDHIISGLWDAAGVPVEEIIEWKEYKWDVTYGFINFKHRV